MDPLWIALIAGFVATAALSAMMLMKQSMRLMPEMDMIGMISGMPMACNGVFGMHLGAKVPMMSLVMHVVFGAVLGLVYRWLVG